MLLIGPGEIADKNHAQLGLAARERRRALQTIAIVAELPKQQRIFQQLARVLAEIAVNLQLRRLAARYRDNAGYVNLVALHGEVAIPRRIVHNVRQLRRDRFQPRRIILRRCAATRRRKQKKRQCGAQKFLHFRSSFPRVLKNTKPRAISSGGVLW